MTLHVPHWQGLGAREEFASVEEAARQFINERMAEEQMVEGDNLAWSKPLVDKAIAAVERGDLQPPLPSE